MNICMREEETRRAKIKGMTLMSHLLRAVTQLNVAHNQLGMRLICSAKSLIHCFIKDRIYNRHELEDEASRAQQGDVLPMKL